MRWFVMLCFVCVTGWYVALGCSPTVPGEEAKSEGTTEVTAETTGETATGEQQTEITTESVSETSGPEATTESITEGGTESPVQEAVTEAATESTQDAGTEPTSGPESGPEPSTGPEAGPEPSTGPEAGPEPSTGPEAGPEPTVEMVAETPADGGTSGSIPTNGTDLLKYLQAGNYKNWPKESSVHAANTGSPHGPVRVYINSLLDQSLSAGNTTHPVGAASVKELYQSDQTTINGYAVMVKVSQGTGGQTWYWYEIIGSSVVANGTNAGVCTGCHSSGTDYFRTKYPLQ